jgi:ATP-dependent Clp protease ATP-binding subunit ClpA
MEQATNRPKWQEELSSFSGITSTFILEGNINDIYPIEIEENIDFKPLNFVLATLFGGYEILIGDPLFGFADPFERGEDAKKAIAERYEEIAKRQRKSRSVFEVSTEDSGTEKMRRFSEVVRAALTDDTVDKPVVAVVNFASRLVRQSEQQDPGETAMYLNFLYASQNAIRTMGKMRTLILVVDKRGDVPSWFYANNPKVRTITIPNPDRETRRSFINEKFVDIRTQDEIEKKFVSLTEGLKLLNIDELQRLYKKRGLSIDKVSDTVAMFKYGMRENKWKMMRNDLASKCIGDELLKRVKGQEQAIHKIEKIIKRAVTGMSGMQNASGGDKPRGILFLAGPTGTGKTEIVKAVTELLFGDEKACIRFDMSEYSAEQSDQKLFGAPPGYVGYAQGGQLTNAVKANPFSVLLFDEIEKAHPSIMDKFLQILEDGRMTDGQGNTVYFSQTLIFFTSNSGISEVVRGADGKEQRTLLVKPGDKYEDIEKKVKSALSDQFKPEVLNRIGENVVVFNYISKEATELILDKQLEGIIKQMKEEPSGIQIEIRDDAKAYLMELCMSEEIRAYGGRGIGNIVESRCINPLAEYIFSNDVQSDGVVSVSRELLESNL